MLAGGGHCWLQWPPFRAVCPLPQPPQLLSTGARRLGGPSLPMPRTRLPTAPMFTFHGVLHIPTVPSEGRVPGEVSRQVSVLTPLHSMTVCTPPCLFLSDPQNLISEAGCPHPYPTCSCSDFQTSLTTPTLSSGGLRMVGGAGLCV